MITLYHKVYSFAPGNRRVLQIEAIQERRFSRYETPIRSHRFYHRKFQSARAFPARGDPAAVAKSKALGSAPDDLSGDDRGVARPPFERGSNDRAASARVRFLYWFCRTVESVAVRHTPGDVDSDYHGGSFVCRGNPWATVRSASDNVRLLPRSCGRLSWGTGPAIWSAFGGLSGEAGVTIAKRDELSGKSERN